MVDERNVICVQTIAQNKKESNIGLPKTYKMSFQTQESDEIVLDFVKHLIVKQTHTQMNPDIEIILFRSLNVLLLGNDTFCSSLCWRRTKTIISISRRSHSMI